MNRVLSNSFLALLLTLLLFSSTSQAQSSCGCDHVLKPAADGGIYFTNGNGMTVLPGEKVCIQGGYYPYISLIGLVGTASQPITIINCGGQVVCGSGPTYCFRIINSRYFKFTGTGTPGITYGFKAYWSGGTLSAGMSVRDSTSDYEIDHLEVQNSQNGFLCKIDPADCTPASWSTGWTIKNVSIHDNYVHKTMGEGMYIVNTAVTQTVKDCNNQTITIEPVKMNGLKLYNNIVDSTGWDGIQVAAATNAEIYNNKVTHYGLQNLGSQQAGIILGGKSNGSVHDNYISDGTGEGLEIFGYGNVNIYNNILANTGWDGTAAKQDAIAVDDRPQPNNQYTGLQVYVNNNTVVNAARNAIHLFNSYNTMAQGNKIYNNLLVKPNNTSIYDNPYTNIDGNTNVDTLNNVKIPLIANAYFVNANANNFHLLANSPAIDKGLNAASYGVTKDYDGVSRPQGSAFDAGAFEYNFGTPPQNQPPVANAGTDKIINLPTSSISVTGTGTDVDGTISSYLWSKISGPSSATITTATSATTTITSLVQGVYLFELKVTDNQGAIAKDTMQVTVNAAGNIPPVANAGADKTITLPTSSVSLSGSGTDADGTISNYLWSKISGPSATITTATSAATTITSLVQGVYLFELKVTDNQGATVGDTMKVTVNAAANIPPVANAGVDKTITSPTSSVSVTGTGTDADGTISSYLWSKISGPSATITTATSTATSITSLVQGVYLFELKVTDNQGATAKDTMKVTVNAAGNIPPIPNAGADKTITLPTSSVSLSGSGTDSDGTISSYLWSKISGPSSATITAATSAATTITSLVQGVYLFELKVTDNQGATAKDTMQVTVNAAGNITPVANAGADKTITLPTNSVSVTGTGIDADGTISNYLWSKISGPSSATITTATSATTTITSLVQGVYLFELKVTDNQGAIAKDTMQVTVNAAGNIPPVANAGADKTITLPTSSVSVTGTGTDADGTIGSYLWSKISGPSATIATATSTATSITSLVQGVYLFELKVTDNQGATAKDTMKITVNAAGNIPPVANAGADKTITLPTSSVSLSGIGTDADGTISSYLWSKISGPSSATITTTTSAATTITSLVQGVYLFELKVTDNQGATARDTMKVTVNAVANIPPVANAGADKTITLPTNVVPLAGSGGDADGSVVSYSWTKISGPTAYNIVNPASPVTDISMLIQGVYLFELKVTDNKGAIGKDTVKVTVKTIVNIPPIANAGLDQTITLPTDSVTLTGKGMDADGSINKVYWKQISGPSISSVSVADSTITGVKNLIGGTYLFEFSVTDNSGATAKDTLSVTVAVPRLSPVVNRIKIYPNPVIDIATLEINSNKSNTPLLVMITDMQGKIVYQNQFYTTQNTTLNKINMSNLTKGIYAVTVYFSKNEKQTIKVFRSN